MPTQHVKKHHHGDLREALIKAGLDILSSGGLPALTLRACAAKAGVSHAAPAHHFKGLPGLLAAIADRGFLLFTQTMIAEREASKNDAFARLKGICRGYLKFAAQNPALFRLVFSDEVDFELDSDLKAHSFDAYRVLSETCAPFANTKNVSKRLEITVWSLVHGYANLMQKQSREVFHVRADDFGFNEILDDLGLQLKE